ncbi:MAG: hypothetical protein LBL82_08345 [Oscillospiraceae bacterium]|jgi:hypothetical protein|nr:hypothetical protein [Oscillospiraceae bacterium]
MKLFNDYVRKNDLSRRYITPEIIERSIASNGYKIIIYGAKQEAEGLIDTLGVRDRTSSTDSYTYSEGKLKLVFVRFGVSDDDKFELLAHELGHILYGSTGTSSEQEDAANAFKASVFLHNASLEEHTPVIIKPRPTAPPITPPTAPKGNRTGANTLRLAVLIAAVVIIIVVVIFSAQKPSENPTPLSEDNIGVSSVVVVDDSDRSSAPTTAEGETPPSERIVWVTQTGKKYHSKTCSYVRYKTNTISMKESEAIRMNYEPCSRCGGYKVYK